jgi:hypothetical protein
MFGESRGSGNPKRAIFTVRHHKEERRLRLGNHHPFPDAAIERRETGFAFLERPCRLRSILATDDE